MDEAQLKKKVFERSAKLFFFCSMNESKALSLAKNLAAEVVDPQFLKLEDQDADAFLLKKTNQFYSQLDKKKARQGTTPILGHFEIPKSLDLGAWREFKRSSHKDEFYITCLFYIGGYQLEPIARTLNISRGTARLRLSRGAKKLGSILLKEYLY